MTVSLASPAIAPSHRPDFQSGPVIVALSALVVLFVVLFDQHILNDGDTYWHIAAGRWILSHRAVPHFDPFSLTRAGAPWQAHEWLSEVFMALSYQVGGWTGLVLLYAIALAASTVALGSFIARRLSGLSLALTLCLALACAAPSLLARPHMLVLPLLILWTTALIRARDQSRAPHLSYSMLMTPWANMHGSFVFGFLILAAFALEALLDAKRGSRLRITWRWAVFGLASLAFATVTPNGISGLIFPFQLMGMSSLAQIQEWRPINFSVFGPFEIALITAIFVCLSRGVKINVCRLLLLLLLLHMTLQHGRHAILIGIVGSLIFAEPLALALGQITPRPWRKRQLRASLSLVLCGAAALALLGIRIGVPVRRLNDAVTPALALAHVPLDLKNRPVFNDYGFGGYLIYKGIRPFSDGRTDLYGDEFMSEYYKILSPDLNAFDAAVGKYDIQWTLLPPSSPLAEKLDRQESWRRLYVDQYAVVFVRNVGQPMGAYRPIVG